MAITATGQKGFFLWLRQAMPRVYTSLSQELADANQLHGLGITPPDPVAMRTSEPVSRPLSQTVVDIANVLAQGYLTKKQIDAQNKILNVQLDRAKQGLAPLDIDPATYGIPQPSFAVGMTP